MSFRETLKTVVNHEDIDGIEGGIELDAENPAVLDQIEAMEDEVALVEAENALEGDIKGMEDGEVLAETADEEVAAAEEVIAEADAKAAESGEAPVVPVEDVVASQEALKTLVKQSGIEYEGIYASREDLYSNSYATYTTNLEGLKQIGAKIKEGLKKIWEKIVAGFKAIVAQIKKVLPTKLNRIKWLTGKIREYSMGDQDGAKIAEAQKAFATDYKEKFAAVSAIAGANLQFIDAYAGSIIKAIGQTESAVNKVAVSKDENGFKAVATEVGNVADFALPNFNAEVSALRDALNDQLAGLNNPDVRLVGVSGKGTTLKGTFKVVTKDADKVDVMVLASTVSKDGAGLAQVEFKKDTVLKGLTGVLTNAAKVSAASEKLDRVIAKAAKDFGEAEGKYAISKMFYGRKAEKAIRKLVTDQISTITAFDSSVLGYALSYGKAAMVAFKAAKKA